MTKLHRYFVLLTITSFFLILIHMAFFNDSQTVNSSCNLRDIRRQLANQLSAIKYELEIARAQNLTPSLSVLNSMSDVIKWIDPNEFTAEYDKKHEECVEIYTNATYGYPFYEKGWILNCKQNVDESVTVLLLPPLGGDCVEFAYRVLEGIRHSNGKIKVLLGSRDEKCERNYKKVNMRDINIIHFKSSTTEAEIWNYLVSKVATPFVLIGRNLEHWTWFSRVQRQLSVFSIHKSIKVVGGSFRNSTGHWKVGCYQTEMSNYVLKYLDGYYSSRNECMFCDYLSSSFIATTETLKEFQLDTNLPSEIIFDDFFLRVKMSGGITLNCPDVMYFASDEDEVKKISEKSTWMKLIQKHKLNYLLYPPNVKFKFSCEESKLYCTEYSHLTKSYLMPPCCADQYIKTWKLIQNLSERHNLKLEIDCGSVLGAIKVKGIIPWDIDGDSAYLSVQHFNWTKFQDLFHQNGFKFTIRRSAKLNPRDYALSGGYIRVDTPDNMIEMYGSDVMSTDILPIELQEIPTKVELRGVWVYSVANPGLYARNRYGVEYLRHAQSWRHTGNKDSYADYITGQFNECPDPEFHACLNRFIPDGNLQFVIP